MEKEKENESHTKTLICALNLLSRDLPLPTHILNSVSSIYRNYGDGENSGEDLITDLEDALSQQRPKCVSAFKLEEAWENRCRSQIQHRLNDLQADLG